ncbi:MAG: hypothetical protein ACREJO_08675 [Phycisphaerales bacterium]
MSSQDPSKPSQRLIQPGDFGPSNVKSLYKYRKPASESLSDIAGSVADFFRRPLVKRASTAVLALALIGGGIWAYMELRPRPTPDYAEDDLEDVLDYTLLTEDFNKLPIEERLKLIKELVSRMKGMDGSDSALLAAFAAGISGKMRDQLMKNADKLAIDVWDKFAMEYEKVPPKEADAYLDKAVIDFTEMMEDIAGVSRDISPAKRLSDAKSQAKRDADRMKETSAESVRADRVGGFFDLMNKRGSKETTPAQRGRMTKFGQDMTRHLRNQDVSTGKPKTPGEPSGTPSAPAVPAAPAPATPGTPG